MTAPLLRVLVVDDNPDITGMLSHVIGSEPGMECVGCLHSADCLAEEIRALRPDVMVLDARMPGRSPVTVLAEIAPEFPGVKTIFYTGFDEPELIEQFIDAGAWGFVSKSRDTNAVLKAIRSVAAGEVVFPKRSSRQAPADPNQPHPRKDSPPSSSREEG